MLSTGHHLRSDLNKLFSQDPILQRIPSLTLTLQLLQEALDNGSFYKPYIQMLPRSFSIPLNFNVRQIQDLKGSYVQCNTFYTSDYGVC